MNYRFPTLALAGAALIASHGAGFAADLPSRQTPPQPRPIVVAPPVFTWTGFYAGLNAGYGFSAKGAQIQSVRVENGIPTPLSEIFQLPGPAMSGFVGGGQVGYNWQIGRIVLGLESDFQGTMLKGVSSGTGPVVPGRNFALGAEARHGVDWFGTTRARVGFTPFDPRFMLYATGGLAYGRVHYSQYFLDSDLDIGNLEARRTKLGWTAGAGAEWAFTDRLSAKLEYLYTDLGKGPTLNVAEITPGIFAQPDVYKAFNSNATRFHTVRAGINYRFDMSSAASPVVAR